MSAECALTAALSTGFVRLGLSGRWARGGDSGDSAAPTIPRPYAPMPTRGGKGPIVGTLVTLVTPFTNLRGREGYR